MPIGILCSLLIYAICIKNRTKSKKIVFLAFIFLYSFANPFLVNELFLWWEIPPTAISSLKPHDIGIVLTGGTTNNDKLPNENIYLGISSDRIWQAVDLYKKGKIKKILISGGDIPILGQTQKKEIEEIAKYLIISGIPKNKIFLETHAMNTRENALNCSKILKKQFSHQKYLLITSGYHLRRASQCFEKVGISVTSYGGNYLSHERKFYFFYLLPREDNFAFSQLLYREIIGYWSYKLMGWV
jgi:uncharacterized SAM-binding protein YcdF (DUF218 family)